MPVDPVAVQNVGWTWTATVAVIQTIIVALIGTGGLYGIFRGVALLWERNNESKKLDTDAAIALRKEMAEITERQQKRIDGLEASGREDRKRFDDEMALQRKAHAEEVAEMRLRYEAEIRKLREEIAGYHRQLITWQQTTKRVAALGGAKPDTESVSELLRETFPVPEGDL